MPIPVVRSWFVEISLPAVLISASSQASDKATGLLRGVVAEGNSAPQYSIFAGSGGFVSYMRLRGRSPNGGLGAPWSSPLQGVSRMS